MRNDEHGLAGRADLRGDAGGQADRREGRGRLEHDVLQGQVGQLDEEQGAADHGRHPEQRDGRRLPDDAVVDAPVERDDVAVTADLGHDDEEQDDERRDLQAAGGAGRATTDEHQQDRAEQGLVGDGAVVPGVEAGGAWLDGVEPAAEQLVGRAERAEGALVAPLGGGDEDRAADEQRAGHEQGEAGVQAPRAGAPGAAGPDQLDEHREAQAADDDRHGDRQQHERVGEEAHEVVAEQREAGVVEGRDRVEDPVPGRGGPGVVVLGPEPERQHHGDGGLDDDRDEEDPTQHPAHVTRADGLGLGCSGEPGAQAHAAREEQGDEGGQGHDPEAADLDQREDDRLSGGAPVGGRVDGGEAGDADRARRREERGDEGCVALLGPRDREHQQQGADDVGDEERGDHDLRGVAEDRPATSREPRSGGEHLPRMAERSGGGMTVPGPWRCSWPGGWIGRPGCWARPWSSAVERATRIELA